MTRPAGDLMSQNAPMGRNGAVWCDAHKRWECRHNSKRSKERCHALAVRGTGSCFTHGGKPTEVLKAQGEAVAAWSALSGEPTVSATDAVLGMLQMSWARAHYYAGLLEEQVTAAQRERAGADEHGDGEARGADEMRGAGPVGPGAGLVGHTVSGLKDFGLYASGEAIRALAQLEAAERDRCVRYAKTCHDMGIAEQQIRLAEGQGQMLAEAIRRILDALNLTPEQQGRVPEVVPGVLRAIAGGAA